MLELRNEIAALKAQLELQLQEVNFLIGYFEEYTCCNKLEPYDQ